MGPGLEGNTAGVLLLVASWVVVVIAVATARAVIMRERALHPLDRLEGAERLPVHGTSEIRLGVVTLAVIAIGVAAHLSFSRAHDVTAEELDDIIYTTRAELGLDGSNDQLTVDSLKDALAESGGNGSIRVTRAAPLDADDYYDYRDRFEITTNDGDGGHCLVAYTLSDDDASPKTRRIDNYDGVC